MSGPRSGVKRPLRRALVSGVMATVALAHSIDSITKSLVKRCNDGYDEPFVRTLVDKVAQQYVDVPVRDYVEVLIAKEVTDELRRLNALATQAA